MRPVVDSDADPAAPRHAARVSTSATISDTTVSDTTVSDQHSHTSPLFPPRRQRDRLDDLVRAAAMGVEGYCASSANAASVVRRSRLRGATGNGPPAAPHPHRRPGAQPAVRGVAPAVRPPSRQRPCVTGGPRNALAAAFGLTGEPRPEATVVGLATLDLLTSIAESQPVCLVVDDARWLDDATVRVLAFVARRIDRHAPLILLAENGHNRLNHLDGLPEMRLRPLSRTEFRALLAATAPGPIDDIVAERVLAEARVNPRALAEAFDGSPRPSWPGVQDPRSTGSASRPRWAGRPSVGTGGSRNPGRASTRHHSGPRW